MLTAGDGNDPVTSAYRSAFRRLHIRVLASWLLVCTIPFVEWALSGDPKYVLQWRLPSTPIALGVFALAWAYYFWGWRCPRCGTHLRRQILEAKCTSCGLTTKNGGGGGDSEWAG